MEEDDTHYISLDLEDKVKEMRDDQSAPICLKVRKRREKIHNLATEKTLCSVMACQPSHHPLLNTQ